MWVVFVVLKVGLGSVRANVASYLTINGSQIDAVRFATSGDISQDAVYVIDYWHDFDNDRDIDLVDNGNFMLCFTGMGVCSTGPGCDVFDRDQDCDVDLIDFGDFQLCFTGMGVQPGSTCARMTTDINISSVEPSEN
jgi:hypothetical protein